MHPEIVRSKPSAPPICGMALEPREVTGEEVNHELVDMTGRFWISLALTAPIFVLMVSESLPSMPLQKLLGAAVCWFQFVLAAPIVVWAGEPFFERGWLSLRNRSLNMFTLISIGTGASFGYTLIALLFPSAIPESFYSHEVVRLYFEFAAMIVTLVLPGQVLELRARGKHQVLSMACLGLRQKRRGFCAIAGPRRIFRSTIS